MRFTKAEIRHLIIIFDIENVVCGAVEIHLQMIWLFAFFIGCQELVNV